MFDAIKEAFEDAQIERATRRRNAKHEAQTQNNLVQEEQAAMRVYQQTLDEMLSWQTQFRVLPPILEQSKRAKRLEQIAKLKPSEKQQTELKLFMTEIANNSEWSEAEKEVLKLTLTDPIKASTGVSKDLARFILFRQTALELSGQSTAHPRTERLRLAALPRDRAGHSAAAGIANGAEHTSAGTSAGTPAVRSPESITAPPPSPTMETDIQATAEKPKLSADATEIKTLKQDLDSAKAAENLAKAAVNRHKLLGIQMSLNHYTEKATSLAKEYNAAVNHRIEAEAAYKAANPTSTSAKVMGGFITAGLILGAAAVVIAKVAAVATAFAIGAALIKPIALGLAAAAIACGVIALGALIYRSYKKGKAHETEVNTEMSTGASTSSPSTTFFTAARDNQTAGVKPTVKSTPPGDRDSRLLSRM